MYKRKICNLTNTQLLFLDKNGSRIETCDPIMYCSLVNNLAYRIPFRDNYKKYLNLKILDCSKITINKPDLHEIPLTYEYHTKCANVKIQYP